MSFKIDRKTKGVVDTRNPFLRPKMFYDIEVFQDDWMVCFEDEEGNKQHFHNKGVLAMGRIVDNYTLVGFNNNFYDNKILTKIIEGTTNPRQIKKYNDMLIFPDAEGSETWWSSGRIVSLDCMAQLPQRAGLKDIECFNGANIHESEVNFTITRKLTDDEVESTLEYCYYDVSFTKKLYYNRMDYWNVKEFLYDSYHKQMFFINSINTTTAMNKLFTGYAKPKARVLPVVELLDRLDDGVRDYLCYEKDLTKDNSYKYEYKTAVAIFAGGGKHGENNTPQRVFKQVFSWDVTSMYPSIAVLYNLFADKTHLLIEWLEKRVVLKREGNKLQEVYKLLINSLYGITGAEHYRDGIYSKHVRESICVIGQMCLHDLTLRLEDVGLDMVNLNTDGVFFTKHNSDVSDEDLYQIKTDWEQDWGLGLEEEVFPTMYQKDVNNYIAIQDTGKIKLKGGYVSKYDLFLNKDNTLKSREQFDTDFALNSTNQSVIDFAVCEYVIKHLKTDKDGVKMFNDYFKANYVFQDAAKRLSALNKLVKQGTTISDDDVDNILEFKITKKETKAIKNDLFAPICEYMLTNFTKEMFEFVFDTYGLQPFCARYKITKSYIRGEYGDELSQKVNRAFMTTLPAKRLLKVKLVEVRETLSDGTSNPTGEFVESVQKFANTTDNMELVNRSLRDVEKNYKFDDIDVEYYNERVVKRVLDLLQNEGNYKMEDL
jgi:hypothetical protein